MLAEFTQLLCARRAEFFSQKLTSWVFNDQPCECADVGQSRTIGRAAKIGWEKKLSRKWSPIRRHGSDFIYTKNSARPRSDFLYTKNAPPPRADFLYTHFFSGPLWDFVNERRRLYIGKNFPAARAKWLNLNKFDTNEIFPLRGLKRYEILEEKGICIQKIFLRCAGWMG